MGYILNIETATKNCSVSIAKNGETILYKQIAEQGYSHAEKLHIFIEELLSEARISSKDFPRFVSGRCTRRIVFNQ